MKLKAILFLKVVNTRYYKQDKSGASEGRRLMAHELTHVVQQGKGRTDSLDGLGGDQGTREALEGEAKGSAIPTVQSKTRRMGQESAGSFSANDIGVKVRTASFQVVRDTLLIQREEALSLTKEHAHYLKSLSDSELEYSITFNGGIIRCTKENPKLVAELQRRKGKKFAKDEIKRDELVLEIVD